MLARNRVAGAVAFALLLAGCGGGGGGGDDKPKPAATTTTRSVSGSVTLSSLVAGPAAASKSADATTATATAAPEVATITIHSYASDGTLTETRSVMAGSEGVFSSQITLHNAGGYIVLDVKSPGTTGWSKRVNYKEPADVDLRAELHLAQTVIQQLDSPFKASAEGGAFRFGVVRYADGSRKAVAGTAAIAAAKAAEGGAAGMDLEIAVPAGALPGTDTLMANLVTFDPNDADDARSFPGDYIDGDGNRLVSVAFDSIEITDEAGNSVAELAQEALATGQAVKAAETAVTVQRWIPSESCASVGSFWTQTGPSGASNGNTIPIYTYNPNSGAWILLGDGTVQAYDTDSQGYANVGGFSQATCEAGAYYLNIAVSSEDYINAWWNLDYPLLASQPVERCVDVTFTDGATPANKLSGIYAELSGTGLSRVSGSSQADGKVRLNSVATDGTPTSATVSYWNPYDYSYNTVSSVTVADSSTCAARTVVVTKPKTCSVTGTVTKNGAAVANEYVWAYSPDPYSYGWAYTGSNGAFTAEVRCDVDMTLYAGDTPPKSFRVDGVKSGDEVTDANDVVAMGTITKPNTVPSAYAYLSSYNLKAGATTGTATATAYVYGYDADGAADYPLTYTLSVGGTPYTGTIERNAGYLPIFLSLEEGSYPIALEMKDKQGGTANLSLDTLVVLAADANRPPVISYAYTSVGSTVRLNRDGSLPVINLYAYAYDPDGGTTTGSWSCEGSCATGLDPAGTFNGGATAGDRLAFTYTATDTGDAMATRTVYVDVLAASNRAPYFTSATQSATTVSEVPADVEFAATASDDDGDVLTYTWKVNGVFQAEGESYTFTVPASATDGESFTVTVEVDDGYVTTPPMRTFTVTYTNTPPSFTNVSQSATTVSSVPATVNFTAEATDADGDDLAYAWFVNGVADGAATGSSYALTMPADAAEGTYTVRVETTDGRATISREFTVLYSKVSSDTDVILR